MNFGRRKKKTHKKSRKGKKGQKKNINFILPSYRRFVFICCRFAIIMCHPHLLSHPHASQTTLALLSQSFRIYLERLCAHHQFKWFSLLTAFLKYLPESGKKKVL
jgi:hypothetical protein